ncbi:MAG: transposase [Chloroflexi bacterium]|nr:transposase [Chloroflexota bacterium]
MKLLKAFLDISNELGPIFSQERTARRATRLLLSNLLCLGRHWLTRMLCATNRDRRDWSADYRLFSRSPWKTKELFEPAIRRSLGYLDKNEPICIAGDETKIKRAGRKVKRSRWMRDPLSPPFQVNFIKGIRIIQFAVILPLHRTARVTARSIPILFEPVESLVKPKKKASQKEQAAYNKAKRKNTMCDQSVEHMRSLRETFDAAGAFARTLLFSLDGGFCNRKIFKAKLERCLVLARCRKDAKLCIAANDPAHPQKKYADEKFTPESVRKDESIAYKSGKFFIGGKYRKIRYKEVPNVLWQRGAGERSLRLIVLAPIPYHLSPNSKANYREPAYLLTDANDMDILKLIQAYVDRWEIEVNHRDEKQHLGVGDPQVWNDASVDRFPAFIVASYAFLLLASLEAYGAKRTDEYLRPPKWQRRRTRPSCLDLLALLRKEAIENPELLKSADLSFEPIEACLKAAA